MSAPLFAWLLFHVSVCSRNPRQTLEGLNSPEGVTPSHHTKDTDAKSRCLFCKAYSRDRDAFDIVWEDTDFLAFRDRSPASLHHIQLIPKVHISSVKKLTSQDAELVRRMESIGHDILDKLQVPPTRRKMGFHIPPFNSVHHLHLHVQALPYISRLRQLKYPVAKGFGTFDKGLSWFSEVGQTIRILEKGLILYLGAVLNDIKDNIGL